MTLPVCLLLLFRREGSGLRVGARGPLGQGAIFEHSGASSFPVRSGMSTSTVAVSVSTLSLFLSLSLFWPLCGFGSSQLSPAYCSEMPREMMSWAA